MIFKSELAQKILDGEKTVTRRLCSDNPRSPWWKEKCGYRIGQIFTINPGRGIPNVGHARVVKVDRVTVEVLDEEEARREGFDSSRAFAEVLLAINKSIPPDALMWRVEFELV